MKTICQLIKAHAELLDSQHKPEAPIHVRACRATLRPSFPPTKRGGPLYVGQHELVIMARVGDAPEQLELLS